jgi:hypothetical protein
MLFNAGKSKFEIHHMEGIRIPYKIDHTTIATKAYKGEKGSRVNQSGVGSEQ